MSLMSVGLRLIFEPNTLQPKNESKKDSEPHLSSLSFGGILGIIGFILHAIYIFPKDEIGFGLENDTMEIFLNKLVGVVLGIVLITLLMGFEKVLLRIFRIRKQRQVHRGSMAVFFLLPFTCIPIHAVFNDQLSLRGASWIVYTLVVIFLSWHIYLLNYLLLQFGGTEFSKGELRIRMMAFLGIELVCAFTFLLLAPRAFGVSASQFMGEYF